MTEGRTRSFPEGSSPSGSAYGVRAAISHWWLQARILEQRGPATTDSLTGRERATLALPADGLTAVAIARRLAVSPRTVNKHLEHLYRKLGVRDRLQAVLVARDAGLVCAGGGGLAR
ncbi:response regulator transcription factor [Nocardioides marmoribigeumensis]|uniref:DNA-binding NarL/FixJ family response regulator n=1 Tax=Nocardioides marmoribigeumensis TaxID=433649 RepID=A0ABU2BRV3_9ACTN|nr:helix-turn-helix transcriptional regulator [Nocardioides marmoribigeumensis]MDR7360719.1 DNA-binding NarL/FixJ family response regulator [Nocardioides marmoribigeumensis]